MPVVFRVPVEAEPVWAYYRSGDKAALLAALGPAPAVPARGRAGGLPGSTDRAQPFVQATSTSSSLLPRLQAECAAPHTTERLSVLKAACTRAQDRWEHRVTELDTLEGLNTELAFQGYPDTFEKARRLQRSVTLYVGPPNSGKTHAAFERLAEAHDGAYLAPLRLLALEGPRPPRGHAAWRVRC